MRVTARGWALVGAGPVLLLSGFLFGYPELAVLGVVALAAFVVALGIVSLRAALTVGRHLDPDRVTRGEPSTVHLTIRNDNRFRGMTVIATDRCGPAGIPVPLLRLRRGHETQTVYQVPTSRRGVVDVGPLRIVRTDPLGLAEVARSYGATGRVWVHPVAHPIRAVPAGIARSLDGRVDKVPHGHVTFDNLREYVVGDDLRSVHWRTSARVGELMVREHTDTSLPVMVVVLDDRADAHTPESFEEACEAAASIVIAALREGLHVRLRTVSGAEISGTQGRNVFLDLLAEATLGAAEADLTPAADRLRIGRLGDTLIFLTGPGGVEDVRQVAALRAQYPVIVVGLIGAPDATPTAAPGLLVLAAADASEFTVAWDGVGRW
ncbi:DUF58 domain-containing protein [Longispora sp. NPDC051575]|uniref:DUF58 domain-containing protein n=1 Tax=Longispora sp. NPDC051575 TaxID=3154943 RepID=UPI0034192977